MGEFSYEKGNLIDAFIENDVDHFIHGANCYCKMGSGIAGVVACRLPALQRADMKTHEGDLGKLGYYTCHSYKGKLAFNAYTQFGYGQGVVHLDLNALEASLRRCGEVITDLSGDRPTNVIGLPLIGCGLGGGEWKTVEPIIRDVLDSFTVRIYLL